MHTVAEKVIAALLLLFLVLPITASASQVRSVSVALSRTLNQALYHSVSVLLSRTLTVYQAVYP